MAKFTPTTAYEERLTESIALNTLTIPVSSVKDRDGNLLPISSTNKGYFTLEPGTSREESIVCTGVNAGTNELTGCVRGLSASGDSETGSSGRAYSHNAGTKIIMTDIAQFFGNFVDTKNAETIAGIKTFSASPIVPTPTTATQAANKSYVDNVAISGGADASSTVKGISKLSSDPAVPAEPVALNSEEVSATGGDPGGVDKVPRANANGLVDSSFIIETTDDPGLEEGTDGGTKVKVKTAGGVILDADGLSVDSSKVNVLTTMPAYESLAAGNLLKTINDAGTYKVKKIVGVGAELSGTSASSFASGCIVKELDTNKIIIVHGKGSNVVKVQVGTISGTTITFGAEQELKTSTEMSGRQLPYTVEVLSTTRFVVTYLDKNSTTSIAIYAKVCTVSGVTITPGSEQTIWTVNANIDFGGIVSTQIATDKIAYFFMYTSGDNNGCTIVSTVAGDAITSGSIVSVEGTVSADILGIAKLDTDKYIVTYQYPSSYLYRYAICTVAGTVATVQTPVTIATGGSGNTITMQAVLQAGTDAGIFVYNLSGASGTLILSYFTVSATTLTVAGTTSIAGMLGTAMTLGSQWVARVGNFIYVKSHSDSKMLKFSYDTSGKFTYIISGSSIVSGIQGDPGTVLANGSIILCSGWSTKEFKAIIFLLDHDEFITSANASYSADDNVPINTDIYTGFSGLLAGADYHINSGATGLTVLSTYKKVGKAINATSIIKS